jgi:alkanesulfonate monooxygenase SsuD/methylene tetrahydromethanopterin reductase-like flavin-dependent oxidoreductase (luciferase family)
MDKTHRLPLKFGIFDHFDHSGGTLGEQYAGRLRIAEAADRAGLYGYHLAEHHGTPHGLAPSPNLLLSAIAQRTRTLRVGPLVMLLNTYHPLRAFEEICMLDQISAGRVDLGIGRGAVPRELAFFGVTDAEARERYQEASDILLKAMAGGTLNYTGRYFDLQDVPITLMTVQKPHPPLWYGATRPEAAAWAAGNGMNIATYGPASAVRAVAAAFWEAWAGPVPKQPEPMVGMIRHVVIAATESEAHALGTPAYGRWYDTLTLLPRQSGLPLPPVPATFSEAVERGFCFAGTAAAVIDAIHRQAEDVAVNYLLCQVAFGDLPTEASLATIAGLEKAIIPALAGALA